MRRLLAALLVLTFALPAVPGPALAAPRQATVLVARAHFNFGRARSGSRFRRPHLPRLKRGLFRRIIHALAFAALIHFLLHSLGGIFVLLLVVVLAVLLVRAVARRRRPRY